MSTLAEQPKSTALTLKQRLNSPELSAEIARVLPKHLTAERMIRVAITALTRTPKLAECEQSGFFRCLLDLSQWGLEPDGRRAHLIPFENRKRGVVECQLILDYKGIAELCYRSGNVTAIHADLVRRGDEFAYSCGYVTKHTPWFLRDPATRPAEAGEVFAVYCVVQMKTGTATHDVMSVEEINAIRDKSQGYTAFVKGWTKTTPWADYWGEMAKKTVFKRCAKWLPWSAEIHEAMDRDDGAIDVESRPASAPVTLPLNTLGELTREIENELPTDESTDPSDAPEGDEPAKWEAALLDCETEPQLAELMRQFQDVPEAVAAIQAKADGLKKTRRKPGEQGSILP